MMSYLRYIPRYSSRKPGNLVEYVVRNSEGLKLGSIQPPGVSAGWVSHHGRYDTNDTFVSSSVSFNHKSLDAAKRSFSRSQYPASR